MLHNNAGGSTAADNTAVEAPLEEFWRAIKLDLYGTFLGCRFGIPALIKSGGGSVINMSSNVTLMGSPGRDCYTAAKGPGSPRSPARSPSLTRRSARAGQRDRPDGDDDQVACGAWWPATPRCKTSPTRTCSAS